MNIRKLFAACAMATVATALLAGSASAQYQKIAVANGTTGANYVTYTQGPTGGLTISTAQGQITPAGGSAIAPANIAFTGMSNVGAPGGSSPNFNQTLSSGTFTISNPSNPSQVYLSGDFGNLTMNVTNGSPGGTVNMATGQFVTFTGGSLFDSTKFSPNNGQLSIEFNTSAPIVASSFQINSFVATDAITFSALPLGTPPGVPEPSSVAGLALGALGLLGLGFFARRRRSLPIA